MCLIRVQSPETINASQEEGGGGGVAAALGLKEVSSERCYSSKVFVEFHGVGWVAGYAEQWGCSRSWV